MREMSDSERFSNIDTELGGVVIALAQIGREEALFEDGSRRFQQFGTI